MSSLLSFLIYCFNIFFFSLFLSGKFCHFLNLTRMSFRKVVSKSLLYYDFIIYKIKRLSWYFLFKNILLWPSGNERFIYFIFGSNWKINITYYINSLKGKNYQVMPIHVHKVNLVEILFKKLPLLLDNFLVFSN
jgi:hypothetical protein